MEAFPSKNWLRWILFAVGGMLTVAIIPVFFPLATMNYFHELLGLGTVPDQPIFAYLARSTSMLYVAHGVFVIFIAREIERHWSLVPLIGWLHVFMGVLLLGIDVTSPMPLFWTVAEGGPIALAGLFIVWMYKRVDGQAPQ